ncbi:ssDNA binding protein [Arthrobacter phage Sonali]|uniref:SsDNA binding protein n=1 Tax=Arthrobacter phage Sonali TaxID=2510495 RepID=A0A411CQV1_9CAUD|nr:single strand DNA binding protein [Arthrobacter phage Sonali]QAY16160.1 ssDNA binding protein [Arthrobacter phage Sonali]
MAGEQTITVVGRLTNDPELRFTPSGNAVANFTIAQNARTFDRQSNEWKDGPTTFWRCDAWREMAENIAESLVKGTGVVATGRLETRNYETKEGEKRSVIEFHVDNIGPDLRWGVAKFAKAQRGQGGGGFGGGQNQGQGGGFGGGQGQAQGGQWGGQQGGQGNGWGGGQPAAQDDPWATPGATANAGGWGNGPGSEPPF